MSKITLGFVDICMNRVIQILSIIGIINASSSLTGQSPNGQPTNIICILVDDLGYGDLSCQGGTDIQTPHIDGIANKGVTFSNFYANCTVCSPSRASLLTGKYPDLVGVPGVIRQEVENNWGHLSEEAVLLPELLKKGGYHTAIIGKWHLGLESPNIPIDRGFNYFKGFLGDMMDDYWTHTRGGINWMRYNHEIIRPSGHATDIFTDWSLEYLENRNKEKKPFFLYLAYNAPHFPIQPPQEFLDRVKTREKDIAEKRAKNVALIEHLDYSIGRILKYLEESGLIKNTLLVFTSDNGGSLPHAQSNGPLRGGKQDMYEGGLRVPAFFRWDGKIKPGSRTDNFAMLMDLFPTFIEISGTNPDHNVNGISLLPTLSGDQQITNDRYVFWVRREGYRYGGQAYYAARFKDFKLLQNTPYEPIQYFNLKADPYETNPLEQSDHRIFDSLRFQLQEHIRQGGRVPWQEGSQSGSSPIISGMHTLSIHVRDTLTHDSVYQFLINKLKLPVYYTPITYGQTRYGGVYAGNMVLEPCGPYPKNKYACNDFRAIFYGMNFETQDSLSFMASILKSRSIKHLANNGSIYIRDSTLCHQNSFIGLYEVNDIIIRDSLQHMLNMESLNGPGIEYIKAIEVGYSDNVNYRRWNDFLSPTHIDDDNYYQINDTLEIQFTKSNIKEVKAITFKVKSLEDAASYFQSNDLFGSYIEEIILLDKSKTFGLQIYITEKD